MQIWDYSHFKQLLTLSVIPTHMASKIPDLVKRIASSNDTTFLTKKAMSQPLFSCLSFSTSNFLAHTDFLISTVRWKNSEPVVSSEGRSIFSHGTCSIIDAFFLHNFFIYYFSPPSLPLSRCNTILLGLCSFWYDSMLDAPLSQVWQVGLVASMVKR